MEFAVDRAWARPGESWADLADRVAAVRLGDRLSGPVLAVDLSADPLRFRVPDQERYAVRPMGVADLDDLQRWVSAPHAAPWWQQGGSAASVVEEYRGVLHDGEATRLWVWEFNGRSVGFAQDYRIADHPEWALLCSRPDAVGIDYLLGAAPLLGRGIGSALLWVFLRDVVWPAYPGLPEIFAAPDHRNSVSRRVLAKLGFTEGLWFDEPTTGGEPATLVGCSLDVAQVMGDRTATGE